MKFMQIYRGFGTSSHQRKAPCIYSLTSNSIPYFPKPELVRNLYAVSKTARFL